MRFRGKDARRLLLAAGITTVAALAAPAAASAASAVVLVSGFDTSTPFTTSAPNCAGQEGETWSDANGPAAALKAAGYTVFTAPVAQSGEQVPPPCVGPGQAAPPVEDAIDSNGDVDLNGAALADFLAFLQTSYDVDSVQLVGHSDGGLWSRSAITQLDPSAGVTVQSLTTLATPHTGSFGADLAETLVNGQCQEANTVEQAVCVVALEAVRAVFDDLGSTTVRQLSSTFLEGWNPQQAIGCPVTVMGGTYVDLPLVPFTYYNPNDGIVGEASALNRDALSITLQDIPPAGFQPLGNQTFPVVHSSVLTFLTPNTMLNQADISAAVVQAVQSGTSTTACKAAAAGAGTRAAALRSAQAGGKTSAAAPIRTHAGFRALAVPRRGTLPAPRRGESIALLGDARLRCGDEAIAATPVLGSRELRVAHPRCEKPLRVSGGQALSLRPATSRSLAVTRRDDTLSVRFLGPRLEQRRAHVRVSGRWRPLPLGRAVPIRSNAAVAVRVTGSDARGERYAATAHVAP